MRPISRVVPVVLKDSASLWLAPPRAWHESLSPFPTEHSTYSFPGAVCTHATSYSQHRPDADDVLATIRLSTLCTHLLCFNAFMWAAQDGYALVSADGPGDYPLAPLSASGVPTVSTGFVAQVSAGGIGSHLPIASPLSYHALFSLTAQGVSQRDKGSTAFWSAMSVQVF